ncbi:MAG: hypothetical protein PHU43_00110 [Candidatus Bipolaricaulis sp.]|nr:hypothetical protein [Candidatus Bipolaricaulis sp.]
MTPQREKYSYEGKATLQRVTNDTHQPTIEGRAFVSGMIHRSVTGADGARPVPGMIAAISLRGDFSAADPIAEEFIPRAAALCIDNGYRLSLTEDRRLRPSLPCTVERAKGERRIRIIHAGY